jgi:hypothetical protein
MPVIGSFLSLLRGRKSVYPQITADEDNSLRGLKPPKAVNHFYLR